MLEIVIVDPQGGERRVPLVDPEYILGRDSKASLPLRDRKVSRRHARIFHDSGVYWIEDLGSSNGVIVNGQRIAAPTELGAGMSIEISGFALNVVAPEDVPVVTLIGRTPPVAGQGFTLPPGEVTVGRVEGNAIVLPDASVSRQHASITVSASGVVVQDLGSSNGTQVNGVRITKQPLAGGDLVRFGNIEFELSVARPRKPWQPWRRAVAAYERLLAADWSAKVAAGTFGLAGLLLLVIFIAVAASAGGGADADMEAEYEAELERALETARGLMREEKWDGAIDAYQKVIERDPVHAEGRRSLRAAERNQEHLIKLESARKDLDARIYDDALAKLADIPLDSYYATKKAEMVQQARSALAERALAVAKDACKARDYKACHENVLSHLDVYPESPEGTALVREAEAAMRKARVKFTPWAPRSAAELEMERRYPDAQVLEIARRFANDELATALGMLEGNQRRPGAARLHKLLTEMERAVNEGQAASDANNLPEAIAAWERALALHRDILPDEHPSAYRERIQSRIAVKLYDLGRRASDRARYDEAYGYWKRGAGYNPKHPGITDGLRKIAERAEKLLAAAQGPTDLHVCANLREIVATTDPDSSVHKEAATKLKGCK